ncbi:hypothetical protein N7465_007686 [Penicillium sp. CMV-2018d]|nr:hypothetical protein N7465_007686 [Penicillium sp. CMV-2018d]
MGPQAERHSKLAVPAATARSVAQVDLGMCDPVWTQMACPFSLACPEAQWISCGPAWTRNALLKVPRVSSLVNARAALGQLIGQEAPAGAAYVPYARGNSPFDSSRVVFLLDSGIQWSLACACCQYSGAANKSVPYQTPLDWPMMYRAEDESWFMDAFERLAIL